MTRLLGSPLVGAQRLKTTVGIADRLSATHPDPFKLRGPLTTGTPKEVLTALGRLPTSTGHLADEYAFMPPPTLNANGRWRWYPTSLGAHHERVIAESRKYFTSLPQGIDRPLFDLTLALHDIGKRHSITAFETYARTDRQKTESLKLIDSFKPSLPIDPIAFLRMRSLISSSVHGALFLGEISVSQAAKQIRAGAEASGMTPEGFLRVSTLFHQSDVAAYTAPAGGPAHLDHVFAQTADGSFVVNRAKGRLEYNAANEVKFAKLETSLRNFGVRKTRR